MFVSQPHNVCSNNVSVADHQKLPPPAGARKISPADGGGRCGSKVWLSRGEDKGEGLARVCLGVWGFAHGRGMLALLYLVLRRSEANVPYFVGRSGL